MYLDNERRPTLTPQLAFRVAVIGGVALVMFAIIFFRLWYLQVLSGDSYVAAARENRVREIKVQAPRGEIVDRHGRPAGGEPPLVLDQAHPGQAAEEQRRARTSCTGGSASCSGLKPRRLERRVERELKALPYSKPTVKQDVDRELPGVHARAPGASSPASSPRASSCASTRTA